MRLPIDREKKLIILNWLKQGYIDTLDLPEAYKDSSFFLEMLMESSMVEDEDEEEEAAAATTAAAQRKQQQRTKLTP